jgi:endonuclease/exonuclease/phosphatase family metal-dependent hydrolase
MRAIVWLVLLSAALLMTACEAGGMRTSAEAPAGTQTRATAAVAPAATSAPAPEPAPGELRVMTYNIHHGESPAGKYDLASIAEVIRAQRPSIVALQEVDRRWGARSASDDQPAKLAELSGMRPCYGVNLDRSGAQYGNLILSRHPLSECANVHLPRLNAANEQRGVASALIDVEGTPLRFYATHLQHNSAEERVVQAKAVLEAIASHPEPAIVAGDFNAQPHMAEVAPLTERYADAWTLWTSATPGAGPGYTIPSSNPRSRIDYVFVPKGTRVTAARVPASLTSDHLPVVVTIRLPER